MGMPPGVPNIPMPQPGQGGGPSGFPTATPGFLAPTPQQPQAPVVNPELAPLQPEAGQIDPLVLQNPVKIKINASERMRTRDNLRQSAPFIAQFAMNGSFLQELAQANMTVDFVEFARLVMDAVGLQEDYRLFRTLSPEEAQKRSQPSPDAQLKMQQSQQADATRKEIMQMKMQGDQAIAQINAMLKDKEISEASARELLIIVQQEQADQANAPDPRQKIMELQMKAQEHGQSMQMEQQKHQMSMQQLVEKHRLELAKAQQTHQLGLATQAQQSMGDAHAQHNKLVMDHLASKQKLAHADEAHKKKVSLMKATPKPTVKK